MRKPILSRRENRHPVHIQKRALLTKLTRENQDRDEVYPEPLRMVRALTDRNGES